jgi:hypothetical protein
MTELNSVYSILILTEHDILEAKCIIKNDDKIINVVKRSFNISKYDLVFYDRGDGVLLIVKDNTSKFSISKYQIQNHSKQDIV